MIETSIIKWIKKKIQRLIAIVEDGDTATHSIASGKYVVWKGDLYKASTAIAIGTTLSTSNLTAVSDGGLNEINGNFSELFIIDKGESASTTIQGNNNAWIGVSMPVHAGYNLIACVGWYTESEWIPYRMTVNTSTNSINSSWHNVKSSALTNTVRFLGLYAKAGITQYETL